MTNRLMTPILNGSRRCLHVLWKTAILVLAIAGLGMATSFGHPTVNIDFNDNGAPTESSQSGVLAPGVTSWNGVPSGLGTTADCETAGFGNTVINSYLDVNILKGALDFAPQGSTDLYDSIRDQERIEVDLEDLIPGKAYTVVVYLGVQRCQTTVQGRTKFNGSMTYTLPGLEDQDYVRFEQVLADDEGKIRVVVEESTPIFSPRLAGIQISGPFRGVHPDARIGRNPGSLVGEEVISKGAGQTVRGRSRQGRMLSIHAEADHLESADSEILLFRGRPGDSRWRVSYFDTTNAPANVTAAIVSIGYLDSSGTSEASPRQFRIDAKPTRRGTKRPRAKTVWLKAISAVFVSQYDRVQVKLKSK